MGLEEWEINKKMLHLFVKKYKVLYLSNSFVPHLFAIYYQLFGRHQFLLEIELNVQSKKCWVGQKRDEAKHLGCNLTGVELF